MAGNIKGIEAILDAAEVCLRLQTTARRLAAEAGIHPPVTAADYLFWWRVVEVRERAGAMECGSYKPLEAQKRLTYARAVGQHVRLLRQAGVRPSYPLSYLLMRGCLLRHLFVLSHLQSGEDLNELLGGNNVFQELANQVKAMDTALWTALEASDIPHLAGFVFNALVEAQAQGQSVSGPENIEIEKENTSCRCSS